MSTSAEPERASQDASREYLEIDPASLDPRDAYRLFASVVVPRPIAWVSTVGVDGTRNVAPFSFFNAVGGNPPTVMFSVATRSGQPKDTLRNARETGEFVVHIVDEAIAERMNRTSGEWPYDVDEFERAGLATEPSSVVAPGRIAEAAVAMEGKVTQIVPVDGTQYTMIVGRIVRYHVRASLLRDNGLVDALRLRPIAPRRRRVCDGWRRVRDAPASGLAATLPRDCPMLSCKRFLDALGARPYNSYCSH